MTNTVMFDFQAAAMAAAVSGSKGGIPEIPEDGASFSDVLAAQAAGGTAEAAETIVTDETAESDEKNAFSEIIEQIENADEGLKKALKLLLETVLEAMNGADDGKERKTDLFMLFSDGSAGFDEENEDLLLMGAEMLNQVGLALIKTDEDNADEVLDKLEEILSGILGGEETDENAAAEALAAMMNVSADGSGSSDTVKNVSELLTAPGRAIAEINPEKLPEMEQLYADIKGVEYVRKEEIPEAFNLSFAALKINNAAEQLRAIGGEELAPELAVIDMQPEIAAENKIAPVSVTDTAIADSVETQIVSFTAEKLADMGGQDGTEELTMILKPENLGEVAVKLVRENGAVSVLLSAQNEEVGKLMADRAASLGSSLRNQNYDVRDVQVVEPNNAAEQMGLNFTNQGFGFMHNPQNGTNGSNDGYRRIDGIEEIDGVTAESDAPKLKEARLWTTA